MDELLHLLFECVDGHFAYILGLHAKICKNMINTIKDMEMNKGRGQRRWMVSENHSLNHKLLYFWAICVFHMKDDLIPDSKWWKIMNIFIRTNKRTKLEMSNYSDFSWYWSWHKCNICFKWPIFVIWYFFVRHDMLTIYQWKFSFQWKLFKQTLANKNLLANFKKQNEHDFPTSPR